MSLKNRIPELLFLLIAALHLVALTTDLQPLAQLTKVLLLPMLILWIWPFSAGNTFLRFGLLASWVGDILLLKTEEPLFFMTGLGAFLLAQLAYAVSFVRGNPVTQGLLWKKPLLALPVLLAAGLIYGYIRPFLGELQLPVTVYVGAITAMALSAVHRRTLVPQGNTLLIFGAMSFMLSDTLLAINKFAAPLPMATFWIMLTYIGAQYGIVRSSFIAARSRG